MEKNSSPTKKPQKHRPRAYDNALVRFYKPFSYAERRKAAEKAGFNVFQFPAEMLLVDLLSDSGTTTLTNEQMAEMFLGDEAYGTNAGYPKLVAQFEKTFGLKKGGFEFFLFHQGRAAEHALFSQLGKLVRSAVIPSNGHFDTTRANIEANSMGACNLFSKKLAGKTYSPFKGDMDTDALASVLKKEGAHTPLVYTTITNNTGGGQPVSLENLRRVRALCTKYKKPFFLDACRFAENAWFIKQREKKHRTASIQKIVHEMFALCDGFTISLKKDGLSNMGGALVIKKGSLFMKQFPSLVNALRDHQILTEGHPTYGGLTGRDIMVLVKGLETVVKEEYLANRVSQVETFGAYLAELGVPVLTPFGGHAVYIDVDEFFKGTKMRREDFGGVALTAELLSYGVRLCELGAFAFGYYDKKTKKEVLPEKNFVRCAVPRNKYEIEDLLYAADCIKELYDNRKKLPRAVPVYGRDLSLRHFKARFELVPLS